MMYPSLSSLCMPSLCMPSLCMPSLCMPSLCMQSEQVNKRRGAFTLITLHGWRGLPTPKSEQVKSDLQSKNQDKLVKYKAFYLLDKIGVGVVIVRFVYLEPLRGSSGPSGPKSTKPNNYKTITKPRKSVD